MPSRHSSVRPDTAASATAPPAQSYRRVTTQFRGSVSLQSLQPSVQWQQNMSHPRLTSRLIPPNIAPHIPNTLSLPRGPSDFRAYELSCSAQFQPRFNEARGCRLSADADHHELTREEVVRGLRPDLAPDRDLITPGSGHTPSRLLAHGAFPCLWSRSCQFWPRTRV